MLTIDNLIDLYEYSKRDKSNYSLYFYRKKNNEIVTFKEASRDSKLGLEKCYYVSEQEVEEKLILLGYVPFINSYDLCCNCIEKYLKIINDKNISEKIKNIYNKKNYIGEALHILDCVSYETSFSDFEEKQVVPIIKRWCKNNGIEF